MRSLIILLMFFSLCFSEQKYIFEENEILKDSNGISYDKKNKEPLSGIIKSYHKDKNYYSLARYNSGQIVDIEQVFYQDDIWAEVSYKNNVKNGITKHYYTSGDLFSITPYINGKAQGIKKEFLRGHLIAEVPMIDDKENGKRITYTFFGEIDKEIIFKNGKAISGYNYLEKRKMTNADFHNLRFEY